jgi:F-type H+-transporting ATPase subunit b
MHIDWFTVIAEVINFLILVWLLKKFLYKPVLKAIDEREKRISDQLRDADTKKAEAKKEQDDFKGKNIEFDKQRNDLMNKAVDESNKKGEKLLEDVRRQADILRVNLDKALKDSYETQSLEIANKTKEQVLIITRKALADIASQNLEEQSVNSFLNKLLGLRENEKKQIIDAFKSDANPLIVQSAFDLQEKQKNDISNAVNEVVGGKRNIQFKTKPSLISGVVLSTDGYKLAWNISEYLDSLEKDITEATK